MIRTPRLIATAVVLLSAVEARAATDYERPPWIAIVPRLGLVAYGRGEQQLKCKGNCAGFAGTDNGYGHEPAFVLGADALFGIGRYFRAGPSFDFSFANEVDLPGRDDFVVGNDWTLDATAEGFLSIAPRWALVARLQGGLLALSPGSGLRNYLTGLRAEFCPLLDTSSNCPDSEATRLGWNIGFGVGGSYLVHERARVRLDALVQYYSLNLYTLHGGLFGNPIEAYETISGARLMFTAGVEIF